MALSVWSEPRSALTTEPGLGGVAGAPQPCPVVQNERSRVGNDNDQQVVPVYWDQTVPAKSGKTKTRSLIPISKPRVNPDSGSRQFGDSSGGTDGATKNVGNTLLESCCSEDGRREHSTGLADEVSFDDVMSMYRSSLVEMCYNQ